MSFSDYILQIVQIQFICIRHLMLLDLLLRKVTWKSVNEYVAWYPTTKHSALKIFSVHLVDCLTCLLLHHTASYILQLLLSTKLLFCMCFSIIFALTVKFFVHILIHNSVGVFKFGQSLFRVCYEICVLSRCQAVSELERSELYHLLLSFAELQQRFTKVIPDRAPQGVYLLIQSYTYSYSHALLKYIECMS